MLLLAIFLPPVYFLVSKRWGAALATFLFLVASVYYCFTILLAPLLPLFWFLAAFWAYWDLRVTVRHEHSTATTSSGKSR